MQNINRSDLTALWLFTSVTLFLAWAAILGQVLLGPGRRGIRAAVGTLALVGLIHPAAAIGALDLVRQARKLDHPDIRFAPWTVGAATFLSIASVIGSFALWLNAGGT